jgi:hypothetical protein
VRDIFFPLTLARDGVEYVPGGALSALGQLEAVLAGIATGRAGVRLHKVLGLDTLIGADGPIGQLAVARLGSDARPVRAILFDKSPETNWALGWHQDRTIAVAERREVDGFGPWTVKQGMQHVAPPFELLAGMLTMRVHLDPVPADNAPLLIAPGSHLARVSEDAIESVVAAHGVAPCLADAGDVWIYATPILHASEAAAQPGRRRVLQIDYAAADLPGGLAWLGI